MGQEFRWQSVINSGEPHPLGDTGDGPRSCGSCVSEEQGPGVSSVALRQRLCVHLKTLAVAGLIHKYTILFAIFRGNLGIKW